MKILLLLLVAAVTLQFTEVLSQANDVPVCVIAIHGSSATTDAAVSSASLQCSGHTRVQLLVAAALEPFTENFTGRKHNTDILQQLFAQGAAIENNIKLESFMWYSIIWLIIEMHSDKVTICKFWSWSAFVDSLLQVLLTS